MSMDEAEGLEKVYRTGDVPVPAVRGVDFHDRSRGFRGIRRAFGQRQERPSATVEYGKAFATIHVNTSGDGIPP